MTYKVCSHCDHAFYYEMSISQYCHICEELFCDDCEPELYLITEECKSECMTLLSSGGLVDNKTAPDESGCTCSVGIRKIRSQIDTRGYVCGNCLTLDDPGRIHYSDVISFLLTQTKFKSEYEVKELIFYRKKIQYSEIKFKLLLTTHQSVYNKVPVELRRILIELLF